MLFNELCRYYNENESDSNSDNNDDCFGFHNYHYINGVRRGVYELVADISERKRENTKMIISIMKKKKKIYKTRKRIGKKEKNLALLHETYKKNRNIIETIRNEAMSIEVQHKIINQLKEFTCIRLGFNTFIESITLNAFKIPLFMLNDMTMHILSFVFKTPFHYNNIITSVNIRRITDVIQSIKSLYSFINTCKYTYYVIGKTHYIEDLNYIKNNRDCKVCEQDRIRQCVICNIILCPRCTSKELRKKKIDVDPIIICQICDDFICNDCNNTDIIDTSCTQCNNTLCLKCYHRDKDDKLYFDYNRKCIDCKQCTSPEYEETDYSEEEEEEGCDEYEEEMEMDVYDHDIMSM